MTSKLVFIVAMTGSLASGPAIAQPVEHPSDEGVPPSPTTRIELAVDVIGSGGGPVSAGVVDVDALRAAIASELSIRVTGPSTFAPALGRLTIAIDGTTAHIAYEPAAGAAIERAIPLPADPDERTQTFAFIATNMIRDQASELLDALHGATPAPTGTPVPDAPPPRAHDGAIQVEIAATIGFVPPLAVDRLLGAHVIVGGGLHALVGATDGSRYASVSGLVDMQREFASGIQIGGLAAVAGRLDGAQIGGLVAFSRGSARGIQIGGLASYAERLDIGAQIGGLAAVSHGRANGVQIGGVAAIADDMRGIQIGGVAAIADRVDGVQIGGVATIGGDVRGLQVGVVNVARKMRGVQFGVVNISDDGDDAYPIGLLNFAKNGGVQVDGWVESTRLSAVALRHGPKHIHNIWALAWSPDHDHILAGAGLGFSTRLASTVGLDIDAMNWWTDVWNGNLGQLDQLRATLSIPVGPIELIGGAAANVYVGDDMDESADFHPTLARTYTSNGGTHVTTWPSVFAGIRMRAR